VKNLHEQKLAGKIAVLLFNEICHRAIEVIIQNNFLFPLVTDRNMLYDVECFVCVEPS
jgi:hypothetical protein